MMSRPTMAMPTRWALSDASPRRARPSSTRPNSTNGSPIHGVISSSWMAPMPVAMMLSSPAK